MTRLLYGNPNDINSRIGEDEKLDKAKQYIDDLGQVWWPTVSTDITYGTRKIEMASDSCSKAERQRFERWRDTMHMR